MKKKMCFAFMMISCLALTGCGNSIPQMTQQEQAMITEYAAGLLLKYSPAYEDKFSDVSSEQSVNEGETATEEKKEEIPDESIAESDEETAEEVMNVADAPSISVNEGVQATRVPLADFLAAGNFSVEYAGFEICDAYSGAQEGELAFEMTASANTKLLVTKFDVVNLDGAEQIFNLLDKNVKASVTVSGKTKRALLTMLEDDLLTANISMQPSEAKTFVVVTEYPSEDLNAVEAIQVQFDANGSQAEYVY